MMDESDLYNSPIHGNLSTSSRDSFEGLDPHDPNLSKLATKMFKKTEAYLINELNGPLDDYKLLEDMNRVTIAKYSDMKQIAENLEKSTEEIKIKIEELKPLFNQIDDIEETVDKLEAASYKLDAYTVALENKFKTLLTQNTARN